MQINNKSILEHYVVHHKQIERRMDGSSGGAFAALLETVVKDSYFFSGTISDENLNVRHIVTNNPEKISELCGYQPTESNTTEAFAEIKTLLSRGEKVLFCGTSQQCAFLHDSTDCKDNLILVDIIHSPFVKQELVDLYASQIEKKHGSKVRSIRYYNREFYDIHSKRITLESGRTIYTQHSDLFDELELSGKYFEIDKHIEYRVSDITIAAYRMDKSIDDSLGYCYLSVNSDKGRDLFKRAKKRLVIISSGKEVEVARIQTAPLPLSKKLNTNPSLLRKYARTIIGGIMAAQWKIYPFLQFIRYNFFTKSIHVNFKTDGVLYIHPNCAFKLADGFEIELHGPLHIGTRRITSSRQETRLRMEKGAKIIVKESCSFGAGSNVEIYKNAILEIGKLNSNAELNIICGEHITLGSPCNIARNATVRDTSGHLLAIAGYKMTKPLIIGNHTWLCTGSTVMPGANIGDGSVVGANSFVTKKIPAFTMTQGNPAIEVGNIKYFRI